MKVHVPQEHTFYVCQSNFRAELGFPMLRLKICTKAVWFYLYTLNLSGITKYARFLSKVQVFH